MPATLLQLLQDRRWYSLAPSYLKEHLHLTTAQLNQEIQRLRHRGIQVNIFDFNGRTYVGLESRRLDYDRDEQAGTNHIAKLVDRGFYD